MSGTLIANVLTWREPTPVDKFNIYRAISPQGPFMKIGSSTTATYKDDQIAPEVRYYYEITSVRGGVESARSAEVSIKLAIEEVP